MNHMGGTHSTSMNTLAKELLEWAIVKKIHLTAVNIFVLTFGSDGMIVKPTDNDFSSKKLTFLQVA